MHHSLMTPPGCESTKRQSLTLLHIPYTATKDRLHVGTFKAIEVKIDAITHHSLMTPPDCEPTKGQSSALAHIPYPATIERSSAPLIQVFINELLSTSDSLEKRQASISVRSDASRRFASLRYSSRTETKDDTAIDDQANISDDTLQAQLRKLRRAISIDDTAYHVRWSAVNRKDDECRPRLLAQWATVVVGVTLTPAKNKRPRKSP